MSTAPSNEEVRSWLFEENNWGRWGEDDERGALNLVTPESRMAAVASIRTGESLSLSRPISTQAASNNPDPAQHFMKYWYNGGERNVPAREGETPGGWAVDFYGVSFHGFATTHLDALCHVWDKDGLYNGRDPHAHISTDGATFGSVHHWASDIVTRGVVLDVPAYRGTRYIDADSPVHGEELESVLTHQGVQVRPGDAVCVHMGRERWQENHPDTPYGDPTQPRAGLHASCLPFLRDHDVSVLGWDMLDAKPWEYDVSFTTHGAIWAYGVALVDNMVLDELARRCHERGAYDFMLVVAPLVVHGGTGSPVNPIALL